MQTNNDPEQMHRRLANLEREEDKLWRISLLLLTLLGTALTAAVWDQFAAIPLQLRAIPLGAMVLAVLFALYAAGRRREAAELRGMVRGLQDASAAPPSEKQLTQLVHAISESQRNYRELIDSFDEVIVTFSEHGIIQASNRAFAQMTGKDFPELVGHSLEEFLSEPTRAEASRALPELIARGQWTGLLPIRLKGETRVRYFDCVLNAILGPESRLTGISVLAKDVTQVRERETRFSELFESLPLGVYFSGADGKILDCNSGLVSLLGYEDKQELVCTPPEKLYVGTRKRTAELQELTVAAVPHRDVALRHKSGRVVRCIESCRPVFDGNESTIHYEGVLLDVTEERARDEQRQRQERTHEQILASHPDVIVLLTRNGVFTYANPRLAEVLDYSPEAILGRTLETAGSPVAGETFRGVFDDLIAGKAASGAAEYVAQHRNGTWRALRATARAIRDERGEVWGVIAGVRDVTKYRQLERQLIQSERLAAIGQMIDGFAHELNNPLTAIVGSIDLLSSTNADEKAAHMMQVLKTQATRAVSIVQNLLFFSRPPVSGGIRLNVSELLQRTLALQEHSLLLSNINVDFIPEPGLPAIHADPNQLMQVFLNMLMNAEEAIREVRSRGTIRIRMGIQENRIWISFQDDGPGISQETVKKMFDPFYTTKRPGRGTGLGLSVAMAILKDYSGTIDAQPGPGGGAVFTVSLPLQPERTPVEEAAQSVR